MSRLVSWLKISRTGLIERRTSMSSRFRANRPSSVSGLALRTTSSWIVVDGEPEPVGEREVPVHDVVGEGPQEMVRTVRQDRADPGPQVVGRPRLPARIVGGEEEPGAEHDVEFDRRQDGVIVEVEQDDVDDAVGDLDLRPLIALEDVLDDERVQPEGRPDLLDLLVRGS